MTRRWVAEGTSLAVALVGAAALARLSTGVASHAVLLAAIVGEIVAAVVLARTNWVAGLCAGTVAALIVAVDAAARAKTWHEVPTPAALRSLAHALGATGALHFPVAATPGVVGAGALVGGMAAVATRILSRPAAFLPSLVLVTWSTIALPSTGAALLAVALVAVGAVALLSETPDLAGWAVGAGAVATGALSVVLLSAVAAAGTAAGQGLAAVSPGGGESVTVPPTALSLVAHLHGLEVHDPDLVMFTAVTSVPTYWQVAALTDLDSAGDWVPDAATSALLSGRTPSEPPAPQSGPGQTSSGSTFAATLTIGHLSSRLLPVPPSTVSVAGATVTAGTVAVPELTTPGLRYTAQALVPQQVPSDAVANPDATDTALPPLPPVVEQLARSVTASASTPLQKAEALTDWFRSRNFHYSLSARPASLVSFLTTSRTGSCQQFAGAFAVLAREVGLPARVAVGFTTGVASLSGVTVVRGIDAHAWPEVLLDGQWVSFEPTPQQPSGELSPPGVIGPAGIGNPNPSRPISIPKGYHPPPRPPVTPIPKPPPAPKHHSARASSPSPWLLLLVLLLVPGALFWRARRARRARRADPARQLEWAWRRIDSALARRGLARPLWRTPADHVALLQRAALATDGEQLDAALRDIAAVAAALEQAAYAGNPVSAADAAEAEQASRHAARVLKHAVTDELARRAADPPSGDRATGQSPRTGRSTSPV